MAASFFFYDLETSGFSPRAARVMQFAGQRTDMNLKPVGEPINVLIKLTPDVLPEPDAVLITGITPQQTLADGLTEAEFLKLFYNEIVKPNTIFVGFNSIRFDDEFMRFLNYRNFYDAYEWQWKDGCSRWDLLDVVRMTRALRPEGIEWPFAPNGKPANRLEFLTKVNKLSHDSAHDALSDVQATIAVAKLVRDRQTDLFEYLLAMRDKKKVAELVLKGVPFVYTSGRYSSEYLHTTAAVLLAKHPAQDAALVYDLRVDPTPFLGMSVDEIVAAWKFTKDPEALRLPVKTLKYNRCPAVAPLGVIKAKATQERLQLSLQTIAKHLKLLQAQQADFAGKVSRAITRLDEARERTQTALVDDELTADERLYDGFIGNDDKVTMRAIRASEPAGLTQLASNLRDSRLQSLLPLYKARNYPKALTPDERAVWDAFIEKKLLGGDQEGRLAKYFIRLQELAADKPTTKQQYLLEELRLYGESIMPSEAA
ncbi:MAG TPA: exodeoxyribonuclease I [Verrucomicrobiae bacterium]|jgi:exodeoxyribonuclease-1|nr:exodeoxyribonuclease I [Verrucomicrobiae bacterium]